MTDDEVTHPMASLGDLFPHYPDDATCLDCGGRWDEHETFPADDGCLFTLNTHENRESLAYRTVRQLRDRGMTCEELRTIVEDVG